MRRIWAALPLLFVFLTSAQLIHAVDCSGVTCEPNPTLGSPAYVDLQQARALRWQYRVRSSMEVPIGDVLPGSESFTYSVPVVHLPGRNGLDVDLNLQYNNRIWTFNSARTKVTFNADCDNPSYGFRLDYGMLSGPFSNDVGTTSYVLTEPDGWKRELRDVGSTHWDSYDSSYIAYNPTSHVLRRKDGTIWTYEAVPGTSDRFRPIQVEDTNGNYITIVYKPSAEISISTITDTAGRVLTFSYDAQGRLSTVAQGSMVYANLTWSTVSLTYNFASGIIVDAPTTGTALNVITKITLANNVAHQFTWTDWGMINQAVQLNPNGTTRRSVRYDLPSTATALDDSPTFSNQYVNDQGVENAWAATFTKDSGKNVTNASLASPSAEVIQQSYFTSGWQKGLLQTETRTKGATTYTSQNSSWTQDSTSVSYKTNPRKITVTTTLNDTGQQSQIVNTYTSYGNLAEVDEYDWGLVLARVTKHTYQLSTVYVNKHILDRRLSTEIRTDTGTASTGRVAETDFDIDNYTSGISASGAIQHDSSFGTSYTTRGNVTAVKRLLKGSPDRFLVTQRQFDDAGNVLSITDPLGHNTSFNYTDNFSDSVNRNTRAYLKITTNALGHTVTQSYYFDSGLKASEIDANNRMTTYSYDSTMRPLITNYPDGGQVSVTYDDNQPSKTATTKLNNTNSKQVKYIYDGNQRLLQTQLIGDPSGDVFMDLSYDSNGRKISETNPYRSTSDETYGVTQFQYDDINREKKIIPSDGTSSANNLTYTYSGNCTTSTDPAGKKLKQCRDGLGRLNQAFEPDSLGNFIYETDYAYDVLDRLVRVDQKGNSTDTAKWRTRTFVFDSLGRKTSETTPEAGTFNYSYDDDGNLRVRSDQGRGVSATYTYDALDRIASTDRSDTAPNPDDSFFYDQTSYNGLTIANGKGRRTGIQDASGQTAWSFDTMGRIVQERRTIFGVTQSFSYTYNVAGILASVTYPSGRMVTYNHNGIGQIASIVDSGSGITYASSTTYAPQGELKTIKFSGGVMSSAIAFNKRLQWYEVTAGIVGGATFWDLDYDYNFSVGNNWRIKQITDTLNSARSQSFTYDELNRVKTASVPTTWGLSFVYDAWGNLTNQTVTQGTATSLALTIDNKNRITNTGFTYDPAGNLTNDGTFSYGYDALERISSAAGVNYTRDAIGRRVRKSSGIFYWFSPTGNVLQTTDAAGALKNEFIYFADKLVARRTSTGSVYYFFADHLGSIRKVTNAAGVVVEDSDYFPFGEEKVFVDNLDNRYKFAGHERDVESSLDYYQFRNLDWRIDRWTSPDPLIGKAGNPQALDRYTYVLNSPTHYWDIQGQLPQCDPHEGPARRFVFEFEPPQICECLTVTALSFRGLGCLYLCTCTEDRLTVYGFKCPVHSPRRGELCPLILGLYIYPNGRRVIFPNPCF